MRVYKAKTWKKGDVLSPVGLNNIEKGIAQLTDEVIKISATLESLEARLNTLEENTNKIVEETKEEVKENVEQNSKKEID